MWTKSVTGELQVVKCSNFSVQKYGKRVSQSKGCDVELLIHCVQKKHPLMFSIITPAFLGRFLYFLHYWKAVSYTHLTLPTIYSV